MKGFALAAAAGSLFLATGAVSQDDTSALHGAYLNVLPYAFFPDEDRGTDHESLGAALGFGWYWRDGIDIEAQAFFTNIETDAGIVTDFYQYGLGIDLRYRFIDGPHFTPYGLIGGGAVYNDVIPDGFDETSVFGNVGLGLLFAPLGNTALRIRAEARYLFDGFEYGPESGMGDWRASIGIEVPLGERVVEREVVREVVKIKQVEVPAPAPVTIDSDGDSVPDPRDQCPNTLRSLRVDANGCAIGNQVVPLVGIHFQLESAELNPTARANLQASAAAMRGQPNMQVLIAGHTDSTGTASYNLALSRRRAQSVRGYLLSLGVPPSQLSAQGYGESQPVAPNSTEEGRAQNRRVEFRVLE